MTKNRCLQHVQKTEHITESDLEFLELLKGNSFQNVTFCSQESTKSIEEEHFFNQKVRVLDFLCHLI